MQDPSQPPEQAPNLDDAIARLAEETETIDGGDSDATAERLIKQHAPMAALALVQLGQHAQSETVRMNTNKYIIDRVLGPVTPGSTAATDPLEAFLKKVEAAANEA